MQEGAGMVMVLPHRLQMVNCVYVRKLRGRRGGVWGGRRLMSFVVKEGHDDSDTK